MVDDAVAGQAQYQTVLDSYWINEQATGPDGYLTELQEGLAERDPEQAFTIMLGGSAAMPSGYRGLAVAGASDVDVKLVIGGASPLGRGDINEVIAGISDRPCPYPGDSLAAAVDESARSFDTSLFFSEDSFWEEQRRALDQLEGDEDPMPPSGDYYWYPRLAVPDLYGRVEYVFDGLGIEPELRKLMADAREHPAVQEHRRRRREEKVERLQDLLL